MSTDLKYFYKLNIDFSPKFIDDITSNLSLPINGTLNLELPWKFLATFVLKTNTFKNEVYFSLKEYSLFTNINYTSKLVFLFYN